jgi:hypothetical protein
VKPRVIARDDEHVSHGDAIPRRPLARHVQNLAWSTASATPRRSRSPRIRAAAHRAASVRNPIDVRCVDVSTFRRPPCQVTAWSGAIPSGCSQSVRHRPGQRAGWVPSREVPRRHDERIERACSRGCSARDVGSAAPRVCGPAPAALHRDVAHRGDGP